MAIDFGNNPVGTPPTLSEKEQIKSVLEIDSGDIIDSTAAGRAMITAPNAAAQLALIEAVSTPAQIMSKAGEQLIASLAAVRGASDAGTCYFATTRVASGAFTVRTSTGYARLVNPDNTLGAQVGTGVAGNYISLTIPASGLHRAYGIISVVNGGSVWSGSIDELYLNSNQITTFSGTGLSSLTFLNLNSNQLTTFSGTGLSSLTNLYINNNQLTTFSGAGFSSLFDLGLNNNQLTTFSGTGLSSLSNLDLADNQLTTFSGAGLSSLTYLGLYNNQLTTFSGTGISSLTYLELYNNQLTTFSGTGLSSLTDLDLSHNQLVSLDASPLVLVMGLNLSYNIGISLLNLNDTFPVTGSPSSPGLYISYCNYSASQINAVFTQLGTAPDGLAVYITGNPGSATCDPSIATTKGWTVNN